MTDLIQSAREAAAEIMRDLLTDPASRRELERRTIKKLLAFHEAGRQAAREEAAEVDALIAVYGIDTWGTGPRPKKKEQARVDRIVEAATARHCTRRPASPAPKEE